MKTPEERGPIGAWAYRARGEAGLSVEQVADRLAAKGEAVHPATIRGIEGGTKRPGARLLRLLGEVLESAPPGVSPAVPTVTPFEARQLELLERQAHAAEVGAAAASLQADRLAELVGELQATRRRDRERIERLEATVELLVRGVLDPGGTPGLPALDVRESTTGSGR